MKRYTSAFTLLEQAASMSVQGGMNIVLKTGASSLLLRDALRRPLAEIELGEVDASLRRVDSNVTRVCPHNASIEAPPICRRANSASWCIFDWKLD